MVLIVLMVFAIAVSLALLPFVVVLAKDFVKAWIYVWREL